MLPWTDYVSHCDTYGIHLMQEGGMYLMNGASIQSQRLDVKAGNQSENSSFAIKICGDVAICITDC